MSILLLQIFLLVLLGAIAFPSLSDFLVLISCLIHRQSPGATSTAVVEPRILVLIPAHNEERLIGRAVNSVLAASYPSERRKVVVVADNCEDRTEEVARSAGAECLVRVEPDRPGKPQALAWATERALQWDTFDWDALIIVDADSVVESDFLQAMGSIPDVRRSICQARNGVQNARETWLTVLGDLLVRARYDVLLKCKSKCGLNCPTAGNGTGIGRELLQSGWQVFSLAEGWELYARATIAGQRSVYADRAKIASQEARTVSQSASQRRRWTAGRWHVLTQLGWSIATARGVSARQRLDTLCELSNPGPVTHVGSLILVVSLAGAMLEPVAFLIGAIFGAIGIVPYLVTYGTALARHPRPWLVLKALVRLPAYALWRIPAGLMAMLAPRNEPWKRTKRH